jgi:hypothetical protein
VFHIIYKTTEPATGRYYIGKHSTNDLDDGYQGSGRWVKTARRRGRLLVTVVLSNHATEEAALAEEARLVTEDAIRHPLCMNQTAGGRGSFAHIRLNWTPEDSARSAEYARRFLKNSPAKLKGSENFNFGKKRPDHSQLMRGSGNPFHGQKHSEETILRLRTAQSAEQRASRIRGRREWNDGVSNYRLFEAEAAARGLSRGRISKKTLAA